MQLTAERTSAKRSRPAANRQIVAEALARLTSPAAPLDLQAFRAEPRGDAVTIRGARPADHTLFAAFSQPELRVERTDEVGDRVISHITFTGRHTGRHEGAEPTGREMQARGVIVHVLHDQQITDAWSVLHWR